MSNPYFAFKQFTVHHNLCAMKVGTDGVLLGSWVNADPSASILDVGTGTGLIALMCAQRSNAIVDAVEIDPDACKQALYNFAASPWNDRITLHQSSFQEFAVETDKTFDLIVSNPPYYRNSLKPTDKQRSTARHDTRLTWECLLFYANKLLNPTGKFCLIIPAQETEYFIQLAYFNSLYPENKMFIQPYPHKAPNRCMLRFSKNGSTACTIDELVIKDETDAYTSAFRTITKDFYLNF